ncbi:trypsin-like serine peptidase [Planctomycetota bacterium]
MRTLTNLFLVLGTSVLLLTPAFGSLDCVTWEDLANHLVEKSIPPLELNLCDCPEDTEDLEAARVVSQVIENSYYLWEEYVMMTGSDTCMFLKMLEPYPVPLTAAEAQVLLTGSMLWRESSSHVNENTTHDMDTLPTTAYGRDRLKLESVFGLDNRTRITNTTSFPWNTHCYLDVTFPPDKVEKPYGRGTGCLVTPYMILTCAHNIYDFENATYLESMTVIPGLRQDKKDDDLKFPYDPQDIVDYRVAPEYKYSDSPRYEYGAVFIGTPFSGIHTYMPLEFSSSLAKNDTVYIAGYPRKVKLGTWYAEDNSYALWDASGPLSEISPEVLEYTADTSGGDSGAPIRNRTSSFDPFRIIGIHSRGIEGTFDNRGTRLAGHNQTLISEWMQWTPTTPFVETFSWFMLDMHKWTKDGPAWASDEGIGEPSAPYSLCLRASFGGMGIAGESNFGSITSKGIDLSRSSSASLTFYHQKTGGGTSPEGSRYQSGLTIAYWNGWEWKQLFSLPSSLYPDMTYYERKNVALPPDALHKDFKFMIFRPGIIVDIRNPPPRDGVDCGDWFIDDIRLTTQP